MVTMSRSDIRIAWTERGEPEWVADVPGGSFMVQAAEKKTEVFFRPTGKRPRADGSFYGDGHQAKARRWIEAECCFHGIAPDDE